MASISLDTIFATGIATNYATAPITRGQRVKIDTSTDNTGPFSNDQINILAAGPTDKTIGVCISAQSNANNGLTEIKLYRPNEEFQLSSGSAAMSPGSRLYPVAGGYVGDISLSAGNAPTNYVTGEDCVAGDIVFAYYVE